MFWEAFWPNLAATVIGVVFGVPAALFLSARGSREAAASKHKEDHDRLRAALTGISTSMDHNTAALGGLAKLLTDKRPWADYRDIDISAWDACKDEIVPILRDPDLQRRLAFHFHRLDILTHLVKSHLDLVLTGARPDAVKYLEEKLIEQAGELGVESARIANEVRDSKNRLKD
jgi:hypothetical protein